MKKIKIVLLIAPILALVSCDSQPNKYVCVKSHLITISAKPLVLYQVCDETAINPDWVKYQQENK